MKRFTLPCGIEKPPDDFKWSSLGLPEEWLRFVSVFWDHPKPTHIQKVCLADLKMLQGRRNLIVSSPTNSGKSLIGYLFLINGIKQSKRALLLEPFRALAQEKHEELQEKKKVVSDFLGRPFAPIITTGDHPLDEDAMTSPPPKDGELIIATPERFDVILRNKEYEDWVASFSVVCVDEAHLISDPRRGGTLDLVLASLLALKTPPRLLLLSATLGNTTSARQWLDPCDLAESLVRWPPLHKEIVSLEEGEDPDEICIKTAKDILKETGTALIAFTYQKSSAVKLATQLHKETGQLAMYYHSNMPLHRKREVHNAFLKGECRLLVSTTALGAGINLPATHLIIRDTTFYPEGKIQASQIVQMMGRAGRGDREGKATVILKPKDDWNPEMLKSALNEETRLSLRSGLLSSKQFSEDGGRNFEAGARVALSILCRSGKKGLTENEIQSFGSLMLAGKDVGPILFDAILWLRKALLVHLNDKDGRIVATSLGIAGAAGSIPPKITSSIGSLLRDLFSVDSDMKLLGQMSCLDVLFLAELVSDRSFIPNRFAEAFAKRLDEWSLASRDKSILFQTWVRGSAMVSKAEELIGSLGLEEVSQKVRDRSRSFCYTRFFSAIVLLSRGNGVRWEDIFRQWGLDYDKIAEDEWIRNRSWLLAGIAELFEIKCFYFHLRSECHASDEQIRHAKRVLQRLRAQCYQILGRLKYCSPLGPLLARIKAAGTKGVGSATILKLENAGLTSPDAILGLSLERQKDLKLDPKRMTIIRNYLRRR